MKLTRLQARARGRVLDLALTSPVAVFSGPTGAGKSTALIGMRWATTGEVATDDKPLKRPGDIHAHLSAGGEAVEVTDTFVDDGGRELVVSRRLVPDGDGVTQQLRTTLGGDGIREREERLRTQLGDLRALDVPGLLALGATDRRRRLLDLCQSRAPAWGAERVLQVLRDTIGGSILAWPDTAETPAPLPPAALAGAGPFQPEPGEDFYGALRRHADVAAERVRDLQRQAREGQAAVDELARQAAEAPGTASIDDLEQQEAAVHRRLEDLRERLGRARAAGEERHRISRRLDALAHLAPVEDLRADLETERRRVAEARLHLADLEEQGAPVAPAASPEIARLEGEIATTQDVLEALRADFGPVDAELERLRATVEALTGHAAAGTPCPTCGGPITTDRLDVLDARIADLDARRAPIADQIAAEGDVLEALQADLDAAKAADAETRGRAQAAATEREVAIEMLRQQIGPTGLLTTAVARAERALAERDGADAEEMELRDALAALSTDEDAQALDTQIDAAHQERYDIAARLKAAHASLERDLSMRDAAARRNAALDAIPAARVAADAWLAVLSAFGREAVAPFADVVAELLPAGWAFRVDLDTMALRVDVGDGAGERDVEALSRGESTLFYAAAMAALASMAEAAWCPVIVDHAEALTDEGDGAGLLAQLVRSLAIAVEAGRIDQAFVATGRLGRAERAAVEAAGAQVVRFGPEVPDDDGDEEGIDDGGDEAAPDAVAVEGIRLESTFDAVPVAHVRWGARDYMACLRGRLSATEDVTVGIQALRALWIGAGYVLAHGLGAESLRKRLSEAWNADNADLEAVRRAVRAAAARHPARSRGGRRSAA